MKQGKILILSTDATRTGTPILLLNYLKWIKEHSPLEFIIFFEKGGELLAEFENIAKVYTWEEIASIRNKGVLYNTLLKNFKFLYDEDSEFSSHLFLKKFKKQYNIKLIFSNSARNGKRLQFVKRYFNANVLTYVHEGQKTLELFNKEGNVTYNLVNSNELIAVSSFIKTMLQQQFHITQPIDIIPGAVNTDFEINAVQQSLKNRYSINAHDTVIMACGWLGWHKGTDFFVQVARSLSNVKNIRLVWLGGSEDDEAYRQIIFDVQKLDLNDKVVIIPSNEQPLEWLNIADLVLILSREESFSLVTVEAGLLKKPLLCFDKSGGPCEIVNFDKRFLIPYADIEMLSKRILELADAPEERLAMGIYLHNLVLEKYQIKKNAALLLDSILRNLN